MYDVPTEHKATCHNDVYHLSGVLTKHKATCHNDVYHLSG